MTALQLKRDIIPVTAALACFVLLFAGGPELFYTRSFKQAWNLGHIPAFFLWTHLVLKYYKSLSGQSFMKRCGIIIAGALAFSIGIELLQGLLGRTPDLGDISKNMLGCLLGLFFYNPSIKKIPSSVHQYSRVLIIILVLFSGRPFIKAVADETRSYFQFPVLSDFESVSELNRWNGNSKISIDSSKGFHGLSSLKIVMNTDTYSGASLNYFPGDWRGYDGLEFSIFNSMNFSIRLTCRIHDDIHGKGDQAYADRFNFSFSVNPGWNTIFIPMQDILHAPQTRRMNLQSIRNFAVFAVQLKQPVTIYLDYVRLVKNQ